MKSDKLIEFITRLITLTSKDILIWHSVDDLYVVSTIDETIMDKVYYTEYQESRFHLYKYRYKYYMDEERAENLTSIKLKIVDIDGRTDYEFDYNTSLDDLYKLVREKTSNVNKIIDDILYPPKVSKYQTPSDLFQGRWKNEYEHNGKILFENFIVTNDKQYITGGIHYFNVVDFEVIGDQIIFDKVAVRTGDTRIFKNKLTMLNENCFEGLENGSIKVKYSKLP